MTVTKPASLEARSARSTAQQIVLMGMALFAAGGTLHYWQAWTFLAIQLVSMTATNVYLLRNDRPLLDRRLAIEEKGEKERVHRIFVALLRPLGLGILVVAGLDRRFGWSAVPLVAVVGACFVLAAGTLVIFLVFRANSYASSVIEVGREQTVVTTGPYGAVRHPMYAGALLGIAATPILLGSYWAELFVLPLCVLFVIRILAEERLLVADLPGYAAYMKQTRKRLLPGLW